MQHVGAQVLQEAPQVWIVVQVEVPVPGNRGDHQTVTFRSHALEGLRAPTSTPGWRHDGRQLDSRAGCQIAQLALVLSNDEGFGDHDDAHGILRGR